METFILLVSIIGSSKLGHFRVPGPLTIVYEREFQHMERISAEIPSSLERSL